MKAKFPEAGQETLLRLLRREEDTEVNLLTRNDQVQIQEEGFEIGWLTV